MREGWKEVELGEIAFYVKDKIEADKLNSDNYISADNMIGNVGGITKSEYVPESGKSSYFIEGDILVSNIRPYFKKMWYASFSGGCSNDVFIIRIKDTSVDSKYLFYRLSNQDFFDFMMAGANGTKMPRGNKNSIITFKINLPPLETQKKITSILSGYDDLIENNLKRIKLLEEMAQQTYEEWFVRMRFPGHESATINSETGLPEGWEKVKLGDLCDLQQGFALNKKSQHYISDTKTEYPLLKISDLINNTETLFVKETIPNQFKIDFEDIIYSRTGQVGLSFIGVKGIIYNNCFKVKSFNEDIKYYLLQFLRQPITIDIAKSLATGAAQPDLNHSAFKSIEIKKADLNLCVRYSEYYKQIIRVIQNLQNQNQRLREARDILLPRLMMGMIEV